MTTAIDNFTGTSGSYLDDHVADTGQSWAATANGSTPQTFQLDGSGGIYVIFLSTYTINWTPAAPDYDVSTTLVGTSINASEGVGVVGRCTDDNNYYAAYYRGGAYSLSAVVAGVETILGTFSGAPASLTLRMRGTNLSVLVGGSVVIGPVADSSIATTGKAGLYGYRTVSETATTGVHMTAFAASDASGGGGALTSGTLSRSATYSNGGTFTSSSATGGTGSVTIALQRAPAPSGVVGVYATVGTLTAGVAYTDTSASPNTQYSYRVLYTDSTTPTAQTATSGAIAVTTMALIPYSDANASFPGRNVTWEPVSGGLRATHDAAECEVAVTATANVNLLVLPTYVSAPSGHYYQTVADKNVAVFGTIPVATYSSPYRIPVVVASGSTTHDVYFAVESIDGVDTWQTGANSLTVVGWEVDPGGASAAISSPVLARHGKYAVFAGDSITAAAHEGNLTYGTRIYGSAVAEGLGCDRVSLGQPGALSVNFPKVLQYYTDDAATSRLVGGKLVDSTGAAPTAVFICYGRNDGGDPGTYQGSHVSDVRAMLPATAEVYFLVPFAHLAGYSPPVDISGYPTSFGNLTTIAPGAYQSTLDPYVGVIDCGSEGVDGLDTRTDPTATYASPDGTHPNIAKHAQLGAIILSKVAAIRAARSGGSGTYTAAANVRSGADRGDGTIGTLVVPAASNVVAGITFDNGTVGTYSASSGGITLDQLNAALAAGVNVNAIAGSGPAATQLKADELASAPALPAVDGSGHVTVADASVTSAKFVVATVNAAADGVLERLMLLVGREFPPPGGSVTFPKSGNGNLVVKGAGGATISTQSVADNGTTQTLGGAS